MDSKLTTKNLCKEIREMPALMPQLTIKSFNEMFTNLMRQLLAREATIDDPESIVIATYKVANDSRFVEYWQIKEREIEDNEGTLANATWERLLSKGIEVRWLEGRLGETI